LKGRIDFFVRKTSSLLERKKTQARGGEAMVAERERERESLVLEVRTTCDVMKTCEFSLHASPNTGGGKYDN